MTLTPQEIISAHMSEIATKRWEKKSKKQRREHMVMMGKASGEARKPRKTRAK